MVTILSTWWKATFRFATWIASVDISVATICKLVEFFANAIDQWSSETDEKESAVCPECGQDAVISLYDATKYGLAEHDFIELLNKMKTRWFD